MSLFQRLEEYGGGQIGSRVAGAFHPFSVPPSSVSANRVRTPDQLKKAKRRAEKRADTRAYLRQVALGEGRRGLRTLGEAKGGTALNSAVGRFRVISESLASGPVLKLLQRMAKKGKGSFDIPLLAQALNAIGWSCIETVVAAPVKDFYDKLPHTLAAWHKSTPGLDKTGKFSDSVKGPHYVYAADLESAQVAFAKLKALTTPHKGAKPPTSNVKVGGIYGTPMLDQSGHKTTVGYEGRLWYGTNGFEAANDKGAKVVVPIRPQDDPKRLNAASFWTWAYKNGLQAAAKAYLESQDKTAIAKATTPASARTLDNTGTCPVCFRNVKLGKKGSVRGKSASGKILDHGYQVPWGYGGRTKACWGVGWEPFEVSKAGTAAYIQKVLAPTLKQVIDTLVHFKSEPDEFSIADRRGKLRKVTKADKAYKVLLRSSISQAQSQQKALDSEIASKSTLVRSWKPAPLPQGLM